jgi:hypothetical protein
MYVLAEIRQNENRERRGTAGYVDRYCGAKTNDEKELWICAVCDKPSSRLYPVNHYAQRYPYFYPSKQTWESEVALLCQDFHDRAARLTTLGSYRARRDTSAMR